MKKNRLCKQVEFALELRKCAWVLLLLVFAFLTGCASTYGLKENWVDDDDMQSILAEPDINKVAPILGTPVFTEYRGDTVEFVYNYRPHLYKSVRNGRDFKPNDNDRVDLWSARTGFVGIMVVNSRVVGLRPRPDYESVADDTKVSQGSSSWIILLSVLATAGIVAVIIILNS